MFLQYVRSLFRRPASSRSAAVPPSCHESCPRASSPAGFRPSSAPPSPSLPPPKPRRRVMLLSAARLAARGVSPSTGRNYLTAVRAFLLHAGVPDLPVTEIDAAAVRDFERQLLRRGISANTSSCYLRSLRAVCNKAVPARKRAVAAAFEGSFTGNVPVAKRSIDADGIARLQSLDLGRDARLRLALDLFLFSFYALGMPLADMASLRPSQIAGSTLVYRRRKTGRTIRMRIEPCMAAILARYSRPGHRYVFPILRETDDDDAARRRFDSFLRTHNRRLKRIARLAGIDVPLTSYTPRHSWASLAYARNVDLPVISKALGHAHTRTTLVYIREIDDRRVELANRKVLESIGDPPLGKRRTTS